MIHRLTLTYPDERMPMDHPALKLDEIDLLRQWIDQRNKWGDYWAYQPVKNLMCSCYGQPKQTRARQFNPLPEADRAALIRRV